MTNVKKVAVPATTWISLIVRTTLFPVAILWPAGTWIWLDAWILIGIWMLFFAVITLLLANRDPELLIERMKASPVQSGQKGWDKILLTIFFIIGISLYVIPGFERESDEKNCNDKSRGGCWCWQNPGPFV